MLQITDKIAIDETEIEEVFIRASGPGGQNVNKVATAVQLRFDARRSPSLPDDMRARLLQLAGKRLSRDGVIVINANRFRSQARNREDARSRLAALIEEASVAPRPRRATQPTAAVRARRSEAKQRRSKLKRLRRRRIAEE